MADQISYNQLVHLRLQAQKELLEGIMSDKFIPAGKRELAEAYALLEGTLTAQPVKVNK